MTRTYVAVPTVLYRRHVDQMLDTRIMPSSLWFPDDELRNSIGSLYSFTQETGVATCLHTPEAMCLA